VDQRHSSGRGALKLQSDVGMIEVEMDYHTRYGDAQDLSDTMKLQDKESRRGNT